MSKIAAALLILLPISHAAADTFFKTFEFGYGWGYFYDAVELPDGDIALLRGFDIEDPPLMLGTLLISQAGDSIHFYQGESQANYCIDADSSVVHAWGDGLPGSDWNVYWESILCDSLHSVSFTPPVDESTLKDICNAEDGGYLICGNSYFDEGSVLRIDHEGVQIWSYTDANTDYMSVAWDGSGAYVLSGNTWDPTEESQVTICRKISDSGELLWEWSSSNDELYPNFATATADGGFVFSAGDGEIFKLSAAGDSLWEYQTGVSGTWYTDFVNSGDDLIACGHSEDESRSVLTRLETDGSLIWEREYPSCALYSVSSARDDGYILAGCYPIDEFLDNQSLVIKTDSQGWWGGTGIDPLEPEVGGLGVHPNPSSGIVRLSFHLDSPASAALEIFDISGRSVVERRGITCHRGENELEVDDLDAGVYLCAISFGHQRMQGRFAVIR